MSVIDWRRAVVQSIIHEQQSDEGLEIIDFYKDDYILDSRGRKHPIPAVARSIKYIKRRKNSVPFSRKNVFIRDKLICQFCGNRFNPQELTYDHVVPRVKWNPKHGTPTNWENIVTACRKCNTKKGGRTPNEAGMKLLRLPYKPDSHSFVVGLSPWSNIPTEWIPYLPDTYIEYTKYRAKT